MCTGEIPEYVYESEFFAYQFPVLNDPRNISTWFMYAKKNCILLEETLRLLYLMWRQEKGLINYFQMHYLFRLVTEHYHQLWENVPYYSNCPLVVLESELNRSYSKKRFQQIKGMANQHKLSYKIKNEGKEEFSFYDFILSKNGRLD